VAVPAAGTYALRVRYCHEKQDAISRQVLIDGKPLGNGTDRGFLFPGTGGWSSTRDDWKTIWLGQTGKAATVRLTAGTHTVTMINDCGAGLNLDWFELVPVEK
jgi:hypothetical protein